MFDTQRVETKFGPLNVIFIDRQVVRVESPSRGYEHGTRVYDLLKVRGHEYQVDLCFVQRADTWEADDGRKKWSRIRRSNGTEVFPRVNRTIYGEIVKICEAALLQVVTPQRLHGAELARANEALVRAQEAFTKAQEVFQAASAAHGSAATRVELLTHEAKLNDWL